MKDWQQGQHDHRNKRRQQRYAGPKPRSTLSTVPIAAPITGTEVVVVGRLSQIWAAS
jgi:hypothetical protein